MKETFLHIIILLCFCCCKNNGKKIEKTQIQKDKDPIVFEKVKDSIESSINIQPNTVKTPTKLGIEYVTAENGLIYREEPNINSNKLGTFDFGTKLEVIAKTGIQFEVNENQKKIGGEWIKVRFSKFDHGGQIKNEIGFVFNGFTVDSLNVDFSKIPIDVGFIWNSKLLEKAVVKFEELDLSLSKTTISEFKQPVSLHSKKVEKTTELKPMANFGNPESGGYFLIKTNKNIIKFPCGENYGRPCYTYGGSIESINAHIISSLGDGMAESFFLDADNNSILPIPSPYDDGNYQLSISPSKEKLVITSSIDYDRFEEIYDVRSVIFLYEINDIKNISDINKAYSFTSRDWEIRRVNWIDDTSFILEVFDKTKKDKNGMDIPINSRYLKATLN